MESIKTLFQSGEYIRRRIEALLWPFLVKDPGGLVPEDFDFDQEACFDERGGGGHLPDRIQQAGERGAPPAEEEQAKEGFHGSEQSDVEGAVVPPSAANSGSSVSAREAGGVVEGGSVEEENTKGGGPNRIVVGSSSSREQSSSAEKGTLTEGTTHLAISPGEQLGVRKGAGGGVVGEAPIETRCTMIFIPPRYHLALRFTISARTTLCRIRTDRLSLLSYMDRFFWRDFLKERA